MALAEVPFDLVEVKLAGPSARQGAERGRAGPQCAPNQVIRRRRIRMIRAQGTCFGAGA